MAQLASNLRHPRSIPPELEPPDAAAPRCAGAPEEKPALARRLDPEALRARAESIDARCPYCHDDIELLEEAWSCCALCLGRHHRECWREHGACASCGNERSLSHVPRSETSVWRTPASFRERLSSLGAALLIGIPLMIPVSVLVGKIHSQGGLVWNNELAALDESLPAAKSARELYRSYLISRNSGFEATARVELELAELRLAEAIAGLERALAPHRLADGSYPPRFRDYVIVLERLRFYHGNTRRALDAHERAERAARGDQVGAPIPGQEVAGG